MGRGQLIQHLITEGQHHCRSTQVWLTLSRNFSNKPRTSTLALAHNPNSNPNPIPLTLTLKTWLQIPVIIDTRVSDSASVPVHGYMDRFQLFSIDISLRCIFYSLGPKWCRTEVAAHPCSCHQCGKNIDLVSHL